MSGQETVHFTNDKIRSNMNRAGARLGTFVCGGREKKGGKNLICVFLKFWDDLVAGEVLTGQDTRSSGKFFNLDRFFVKWYNDILHIKIRKIADISNGGNIVHRS